MPEIERNRLAASIEILPGRKAQSAGTTASRWVEYA
jgi:hypothetical protein